MESYTPGAISNVLFANSTKKPVQSKNPLQQLFSSNRSAISKKTTATKNAKRAKLRRNVKHVEPSVSKEAVKEKPKTKKQKKSENETSAINVNNLSSEFPYIHETLIEKRSKPSNPVAVKRRQSKTEEDEENVKRPRRDRKRNKLSDNRTVFVGNCPLNADKKTLAKLFKHYGAIESVRFRCGPTADLHLPRRAVVITKSYHEKSSSYVGYVVFEEEEAAKKALALNGHILDGHHLRVDMSSQSRRHDKKRSVFVGNLPFTVQEENLRSHFEDCGTITNVRIVRDRKTSIGKGIAYVQFEAKDAVNLAVKLNKSKLDGREIRVMVCTIKPGNSTTKEKKSSQDSKTASSSTRSGAKKLSFAPSNASTSSFKALQQKKIEKRMRKQKKKKNAKKSDSLSSIFGDVPVTQDKNMGSGKSARLQKSVKGGKRTSKSSGGHGNWTHDGRKNKTTAKSKRIVFE